jgi:hypothetical protein
LFSDNFGLFSKDAEARYLRPPHYAALGIPTCSCGISTGDARESAAMKQDEDFSGFGGGVSQRDSFTAFEIKILRPVNP